MKQPVRGADLTRKEKLDKVRGEKFFEDPNKGPAKKDSKRNDWSDPQN
ncbi:hypothetical protein V6C32_08415 [Desulforamulus ruminis]